MSISRSSFYDRYDNDGMAPGWLREGEGEGSNDGMEELFARNRSGV